MKSFRYLLLAAALVGCCPVKAQGTVDDYRRAYAISRTYSARNVFYADVVPHWVGATHTFWYIRHTPQGPEYVAFDADRKTRRPLFNHTRLAARLAAATASEVKADNISLQGLDVSTRTDSLRFVFKGHRWEYAVKSDKLRDCGPLPPQPTPRHWMERDDEQDGAPVTSPDGKTVAYIKNSNIYVRPASGGQERQLSYDGTDGNYYSTYIQWSPDSRRVAACRIRPTAKRYVYYVESSPKDQLQPRLHKQEYAKPGDELPFRVPCIYDVATGRATIADTRLFASQYEVTTPVWDADSRGVTFEYNERGHKAYRVLALSADDGSVTPLIDERDDKYIAYSRRFRHDLADGRHILWASERDGHRHLYIYDRNAPQTPARQITSGQWWVRDIQRVDEKQGVIYFSANGVEKGVDPYLIRYYRVGLDGTGMTCLTPGGGTHQAWYSEDMRYLVDVSSSTDTPPVAVLRSVADGSERQTIERADISRLTASGWKAPETFVAKGRDGKTDMWGLIQRPTNFSPDKRYPVIEYIYQGPGDHYVPKTFTPYNWTMTSLAELGFIVVMVDGMGTSFRSKDFEQVCYKNLRDAGLPDHIAWLKAAGAKYPYMDLDRVGIYGCSAGGQESTAAVLFHPEFYKAAYSACGCHDNRMDKIWWNEQWMGYPVDSTYAANSNVVNAYRLSRPLMLMVGEMDDNVDPSTTMQFADALIKAGKDFELVVVPGAHHSMGEAFGDHKRYDFFVRHLLGVTPPKWDAIRLRRSEE